MGTKEWGPAGGLSALRTEIREERPAPTSGEVVVVAIRVPFWNLVATAIQGLAALLIAVVVMAPVLALMAFGAVFAVSLLGAVLMGAH